MAFRMQSSVPGLTEITGEPKSGLDLYGITEPEKPSFARNCLLARRMVERGVRFVQLYHRGWDHHGGVNGGTTFGKTDDLGYGVVEDRSTVHDLHATMLHLCGIDDSAFTCEYQGLDFKLSGVEPARVMKEILG